MKKYSTLIFGLFVFLGTQTVFSEEYDGEGSDEVTAVATAPQAELPATRPTLAPVVAGTADDESENDFDAPSGPAESCLFSIYRGAPAPVSNESEDIVVNAYDFDTDFYTASNLGGSTPGYSFFLSHNNMLSTSASFNILDTTGGLNKQWECSRSKRLRRGLGTTAYDPLNDDDNADEAKTNAEMSTRDQWGSGAKGAAAMDADERSAVYFVKAGTKTFRVSCSVENGFMGAHKNKDCRARVVNGGASAQANVKVCEASRDDSTDFIEKSLRRRERFLEHHTPTNRVGWVRLRDGYNAMKQNCAPLISSDHGAKDALHDLGQEVNERLGGYNKSNRGPNSVEPVVVSGR